MPTVRRAIPAAAVLALAAAPAAHAASPHRARPPVVRPAAPIASDTLTVTVRVPAGVRAGRRYAIAVTTRRGGACASYAIVRATGTADPGDRITLQLTPRTDAGWKGWCAGTATASLLRRTSDGGWSPLAGAHRAFTIRREPAFSDADLFGTKVQVDVLPGSTATVSVLGRPDRTLEWAGGLAGFIPGRFVLNTDYEVLLSRSTMYVAALVPDPMCGPGAIRTGLGLGLDTTRSGSSSSLTVLKDGGVTGTLVLAVDAPTLAGCPGAAAGTTTIGLKGTLGSAKLADVPLTGSLAGVPVGGSGSAATGTVTVALHLKLTILD